MMQLKTSTMKRQCVKNSCFNKYLNAFTVTGCSDEEPLLSVATQWKVLTKFFATKRPVFSCSLQEPEITSLARCPYVGSSVCNMAA